MKYRVVKIVAIAALAALVGCGGSKKAPAKAEPATAPQPAKATEPVAKPVEAPAPPSSEALAQAALAEQYDAGQKVYAASCASCHGDHGEGNPKNPALIGAAALPEKAGKTAKLRKGVAFKTAQDVFAFAKAKMPLKKPGTLSDDDCYAVVSWVLSENKADIKAKLDASNAASVSMPKH